MSTTIPGNQILPVNSTTYVDMLGVIVGMDRLPAETASDFAERLELAVSSKRGPDYAGLINAIMAELGLETFQAIQVGRADGQEFDAQVTFGQLAILFHGQSTVLPLVSLTSDNFWEWGRLSDVAAAIQQIDGFTASLLSADGPALQLAFQQNGGTVIHEDLSAAGRSVRLGHGTIVAESLLFNQAVPAYTLGPDGQTLHFLGQPPSDLAATYRYRLCPYTLVGSPAAVFSLTDPNLVARTAGSNGTVIYQVMQYIQEIMARDGSYWGR